MKIAVFASGGGSNFLQLARACISGDISAQIVSLVASRDGIGAIEHAKDLSIPFKVFKFKDFSSAEEWDRAITDHLVSQGVELIVLAGYLKKIGPILLSQFSDQIVNTHPSLLPKFGGPGMYGSKVHKAVMEAGEPESGITIHKVSEEYDKGRILAQAKLSVLPDDTAESLEARLRELENKFIVDTVAQIVNKEIKLC